MRFVIVITILLTIACKKKQPILEKQEPIKKISYSKTTPPPGMRFINGGTFDMGDPQAHDDASPVHKVTLTSFYIDTTEVTQNDYHTIIGNPLEYIEQPNYPITEVSWFGAIEYCNERSKKHGFDTVYSVSFYKEHKLVDINYNKIGYRLPTEAEWEYACRANSGYVNFYCGEDFENYEKFLSVAKSFEWFRENSGSNVHPAAQKKPNPWGLYDMMGNVEEWCNDWYGWDYYSKEAKINPTGPKIGYIKLSQSNNYEKVTRGGSFRASETRLTIRHKWYQNESSRTIGFRCVLPAPEENSQPVTSETGL